MLLPGLGFAPVMIQRAFKYSSMGSWKRASVQFGEVAFPRKDLKKIKIIKLPPGPEPSRITAQLKGNINSIDPFALGTGIKGNNYEAIIFALSLKQSAKEKYNKDFLKFWRIANKKKILNYAVDYHKRNKETIHAYKRTWWCKKTKTEKTAYNLKRRLKRKREKLLQFLPDLLS